MLSSIILFLSGGCYLILRHVGKGREGGFNIGGYLSQIT